MVKVLSLCLFAVFVQKVLSPDPDYEYAELPNVPLSPGAEAYIYTDADPKNPPIFEDPEIYSSPDDLRMHRLAREAIEKANDFSQTSHPSFVYNLDKLISECRGLSLQAGSMHLKIVNIFDQLFSSENEITRQVAWELQNEFGKIVSAQIEEILDLARLHLHFTSKTVEPTVPLDANIVDEPSRRRSIPIAEPGLIYEKPVKWLQLYFEQGVQAKDIDKFDMELVTCLIKNIKDFAEYRQNQEALGQGSLTSDLWDILYGQFFDVAKTSFERTESLSGFDRVNCKTIFKEELDLVLCEAYKRVYASNERIIIQNIFGNI